jgi:hypothetical protein
MPSEPEGDRRSVSGTSFSTCLPAEPADAGSAAALKWTAFNAILQGRCLSRAELVQAAGAAPDKRKNRPRGCQAVANCSDAPRTGISLTSSPSNGSGVVMVNT